MQIRQAARAVRTIDRFAELCGVAIAWLMVALIAAVVYEVVARYGSLPTSRTTSPARRSSWTAA